MLLLPPAEPAFVGAYAIPDTYNPHDDKVYIFFRETAMEAGQWERRHIHARVARVCKVSHQRSACRGRVSRHVGFHLFWAMGHPKQRPTQCMGLSPHPHHRSEGSGLGVSRCGVREAWRGWAEPGSWCPAERRRREAQPHQPLEHVPQGPPGVLHPWAPGHRDPLRPAR